MATKGVKSIFLLHKNKYESEGGWRRDNSTQARLSVARILGANYNFRKKQCKSRQKPSRFTKKITRVDDMMIHNVVKYLVHMIC
jgi:hypothetical protein